MRPIIILVIAIIAIFLLIVHYVKSARTSSIRADLENEFNLRKKLLEKDFIAKDAEVAQREKAVALQEDIVKSAEARAQWASKALRDVEERERILSEKEQAISGEYDRFEEAVRKAISKKESAITERERIVAIRSHTLSNRESAIAEREQDISAREKGTKYLLAQKWDELDNWERHLNSLQSELSTNLTALPYMAAIIADFDTRGLEILARKLDWGSNIEREKKVASIRSLRKETQQLLAQSKEAEYQLAYAIKMFPALEDFLETDYSQLPKVEFTDISSDNHDEVRNFLSVEEYASLFPAERNQLALDRYRQSHQKTNWQIGRDYEHFIGYRYTQKGYAVEYYGANHGIEDLGRDLIAKKHGSPTLIIQCKYWSSKKTIHEKHINQLYGTMMCYCFENGLDTSEVRGVLVTNISVSYTARNFARYLGIELVEHLSLGEYPCIKCNINTDKFGNKTKIYHLPFDQQYDACKIDSPGEFFAMTVAEAEAAGFRRAFKWYGET